MVCVVHGHRTIQHIVNTLLLPSTPRSASSSKQTKRTSSHKKSLSISARQSRVHAHGKDELAISDVERTVEMSETRVRLMQRKKIIQVETRALVHKNADHGRSKTSKRSTDDLLNEVLKAKRQKLHQPLSATPAGQHTLTSSSRMISIRPGGANSGDEGNNPSGRKPRSDENSRGLPPRRSGGGDPDGDGNGGDGGDDYGKKKASRKNRTRNTSSDDEEPRRR